MNVQSFILKYIANHPYDIASFTMQKLGVSRTTVNRHLHHLIKANKIIKTGNTRQTCYTLVNTLHQKYALPLDQAFDEFLIFNQLASPVIKAISSQHTFDIFEYGLTEMLNNCKDHSDGRYSHMELLVQNNQIICKLKDDGIGAFKSLGQALNMDNVRDIMLELSKGKLTSDPSNHTGEGVFFTSRAFDYFKLSANQFTYERDNIEHDWTFFEDHTASTGTTLEMIIERDSTRSLKDLFINYQDEELAFVKTDIIVDLSQHYGERLISRSQAKRITRNLDKFSHITLDFKKIQAVGQGFVDQIFRVYQLQNPHMTIKYINANEDVTFMIKRGISNNKDDTDL